MSGIFDESVMRETLGQYIPYGETLLAGIHAVSRETVIKAAFTKCVRAENSLLPDENGGTVALRKKKYGIYDLYIGITQSSLLIAACEQGQYLYQFDKSTAENAVNARELTSPISLDEIGTCFPLTEIQSCEMKKSWMGSVKCSLTMKNGSSFKLILPKLGGLGGGMPNHAAYREKIIERLNRCD